MWDLLKCQNLDACYAAEKRKLEAKPAPRTSGNPPLQPKLNPNQPKSTTGPPNLPPLKPSKLLSSMASIHAQSKVVRDPVERSTSFFEVPKDENRSQLACQERDDRLALVEALTPGPQAHVPPVDDPHFARLEPNSGIHLSYVYFASVVESASRLLGIGDSRTPSCKNIFEGVIICHLRLCTASFAHCRLTRDMIYQFPETGSLSL